MGAQHDKEAASRFSGRAAPLESSTDLRQTSLVLARFINKTRTQQKKMINDDNHGNSSHPQRSSKDLRGLQLEQVPLIDFHKLQVTGMLT